MSSIIPFRFGNTAPQDDNLSGLLAAGTEAVNTSALAYERLIPPVRDWTNQEMADLARVQYLLSRAGVQLETDRGLSDEGDPWFVFCDPQGEVFVHICRMGMTYLLDGPSLDSPLRGPSFDALVKSFIDRATAKVAALNVVPLNKDNKVFLHPSVMLTALIWSLFLLNDQMTNAAYASAFEESKATVDQAHYDVETAFALLADALQDNGQDLDLAGTKVLSKLEHHERQGMGADKISVLSPALLNPTVITSLSAIALAFGLLQPAESIAATLPEATVIVASAASGDVLHIAQVEAHERSAAPKVDDSAHRLEEHQLSHDGTGPWFQANTNYTLPDLTANLRVITLDLMGALAQDRDFILGSSRTESAAADAAQQWVLSGPHGTRTTPALDHAEGHEVETTVSRPNTSQAKTTEADANSTVTFSTGNQIQTFAQLADQIVKHAAGLIVVQSTEASAVATSKIVGHVHEMFLATYTENTSDTVKMLLKFETADPTVASKNETGLLTPLETTAEAGTGIVSASGALMTAPPKESAAPAEASGQHQLATYNQAARDLVDYLLAKQKDIIVITLDDEIIILDKSALDEATDVAFAKSWAVEGGGVVSTIGHFSDYKDFGLLS